MHFFDKLLSYFKNIERRMNNFDGQLRHYIIHILTRIMTYFEETADVCQQLFTP